MFANAVPTKPSHKLGDTAPPPFLQSLHSENKNALNEWFENSTEASPSRTIPEGLTSNSARGDELSNIRSPPTTIFPFQPHPLSPPKTTSQFMPFLSHSTRKTKKLEGLIILWLNERYNDLCLSETIRKPDLPFVWNSKHQDIKTFSSLHPEVNLDGLLYLGQRYVNSQLRLRFIRLLGLFVRLPYIYQECSLT